MPGNRRIGRTIATFRIVLALPAVLTLATAPLSAAAPGFRLVPMCTAAGPQLVLIGGEDPAAPPADRHQQGGMTCAHALCPRELLAEKKTRTGI